MKDGSEPGAPIPADRVQPAAAACDGRASTSEIRRPVPILVVARIFLEIGATCFGGLGPSLVIIDRELVEKRRILTAADVAESTAATKLLPGSTFIQVMSFLGYRLGGWTGSAVATVACMLPPVTAMLLLAVSYDAISSLPAFGQATRGLTAVVVGLLSASTYRFGRATTRDPVAIGIAFSAFGASAGLGVPAALVIVAAGLIGIPLLSASGAERGWSPGAGGRS